MAKLGTLFPDQLVDTAQDEAWKIVGLREPVLAAAGQSRQKVFDTTRIGDIKRASRKVTTRTAAKVAENLRSLPSFEERDRLAERPEKRGAGMGAALQTLAGLEERGTGQRASLGRMIDAQRVAVVATYGRLLTVLPKGFVETLFPRARERHVAGPKTEPAPAAPTA